MASTNNNFDKTMSLYIPRVDTRSLPRGNRHSESEYEAMVSDFIGKQFKYQRIGQASRVDLLKKQTPQGFDYFIAFVHFSEWFDTYQARAFQEEILTKGAKAKLHFHNKWYWIVNENKSPLSANVASLHKTIYEQAKSNGMMNEAVTYLKSLKSVATSVAEAVLTETAEQGFGSTWNAISPPPKLTKQQTIMAPQIDWNTPTDYPPLCATAPTFSSHLSPGPPDPLERSETETLPDLTLPVDPQFQTPHRNNQPDPLSLHHHTRSSVPSSSWKSQLTPQDIFGPTASSQWPASLPDAAKGK